MEISAGIISSYSFRLLQIIKEFYQTRIRERERERECDKMLGFLFVLNEFNLFAVCDEDEIKIV